MVLSGLLVRVNKKLKCAYFCRIFCITFDGVRLKKNMISYISIAPKPGLIEFDGISLFFRDH